MGVPGQPRELAERSKGFKCIVFGIGGSLKSEILILVFDSLVGKAAHC